jgi:serine phosphatase RsbU (regulator of sigma subunit)
MTTATRDLALLVAILTALSLLLGAVLFMARLLWKARGAWDETNYRLRTLAVKVDDVARQNDREHKRLDQRANRLDDRILRHERWHNNHLLTG